MHAIENKLVGLLCWERHVQYLYWTAVTVNAERGARSFDLPKKCEGALHIIDVGIYQMNS